MKRFVLGIALLVSTPLWGIPTYARRYNKSCVECHVGYPKLHYGSEKFKYNNYMPPNYNPRMKTVAFRKDQNVYLPMESPVSFRFQTFLGLLSRNGEFTSYGEIGGNLLLSYNTSSISSFYVALEYFTGNLRSPYSVNALFRDAFFNVSLPAGSRLIAGRFDLSEFFVKRSTRLTYHDLVAYTRGDLIGTGLALSLTPYLQAGVLDVEGMRTFLRAGANTKYFGFGVSALPVDGAQRYVFEMRTRFAFFDFFTVTVLGLNQKLGKFELKDTTAFITGSYGLDLTFGRFFTSLLYNYIGNVDKMYMPPDHTGILTWAVGFYPVSNVRVLLESGFNFARKFPGDGSYTGVVLDWSF